MNGRLCWAIATFCKFMTDKNTSVIKVNTGKIDLTMRILKSLFLLFQITSTLGADQENP